MTLEKLLIFGFAIAVVAALATNGRTIADNRTPDYRTYHVEVTELVAQTQNPTAN